VTGESETALVPYNNYSFAILWHQVVNSVEEVALHLVSQVLQYSNNFVEIPPISVKKAFNVLEHPELRLYVLNGGYESREAIARVLQSVLMSANAKWLARRATNYYVRIRERKLWREEGLAACSLQIFVVGCTAVRVHFEPDCLKASSLETQREPAATCKQV
jgi:hypothetical protein